MGASDLPAPPTTNAAGPGAIERAIIAEQQKARRKNSDPTSKHSRNTSPSEAPAENENDKETVLQTSSNGTPNGDEHVDVPLDTPPASSEEQKHPMESVRESFEDVAVNDDGDSEGHRTPRQGNGHATFSTQLVQMLQEASSSRSDRQAASSAAAWSDITKAAVDHSDEHVTKSVQLLLACLSIWDSC